MGLFKKASPEELRLREAESELTNLAGSIGQAVGRCATGEMPHDFLSSIVEAHSERLQEVFAEVARGRGRAQAWKQAIGRARYNAKVWAHDRIPSNVLAAPVADALNAALGRGTDVGS